MQYLQNLLLAAIFSAVASGSLAADPSIPPGAPRSDGGVLHVDFENYADGVVQALNAGVRWLGHPFSDRDQGEVRVLRDFGFSGTRCAHVATEDPEQLGRVVLQPRYDAPPFPATGTFSFCFRVTRGDPVDLKDFVLWSTRGEEGRPTGIKILAQGEADAGLYRVEAIHAGSSEGEIVASALEQNSWVRFTLQRDPSNPTIRVWIGAPGKEEFCGAFEALNPEVHPATIEFGDLSDEATIGSGYWDDVLMGGPLAAGKEVRNPEPPLRDVSLELPVTEPPIVLDAKKQLFVDDFIVETSKGLTRELHAIDKHPDNPLIVPDRPWEGQCVLLYGSVLRDPATGLFRMWYLAWGKHIGKPSFICYAESEDGLIWRKPDLDLNEYEGSKTNNTLMPGWSQTTILHDPRDEDPSRRYKAVIRINGTRAFTSPDGFRWKDEGILLDQAYDGTTVHWDSIDEKWVAMVKVFKDGKRARGYAESPDFFYWTDTYLMATVDERDDPGDQMYAVYLFCYEGVYFGLLRMYDTATGKIDIQLMTSRNGKRWDRSIRTPFIPTSNERGTWDYGNNAVPSTPPIRIGDELRFYYSGRSTLHDEVPNTGAIGLGTIRLDGFCSMDAGPEGGTLTTRPLLLEGSDLFVNADAERGSLDFEILDPDGNPIRGFARDDSIRMGEDGVRLPAAWREGADLASLRGRTIRLRFHLTNAKLYAFWAE